jgi:hypothetical protein
MEIIHPFPFIKELENIPRIASIQDIITINNFVYSLISLTQKPYLIVVADSIESLYKKFKNKEIGGWCGTCANFFNMLMNKYKISTRIYNFGLADYKLTHMGVIVTFDGMNLFFDPYFAKHYTYCGEFPLQFDSFLHLVTDRQYEKIVPAYGNGVKAIEQSDGSWKLCTPRELEKNIMEGFKIAGYEKIMQRFFKDPQFENLFLIEDSSFTAKILRNIGNINE